MTSNPQPPSWMGLVWQSAVITGLSAPMIVGCNRVVMIASDHSLTTANATRQIYAGRFQVPAGQQSLAHFMVGVSPHLARELPRSFLKGWGTYGLVPYLDQIFPGQRFLVSSGFALYMTLADYLLSPLDTIRVRLQSCLPAIPTLAEAGSRNRFSLLFQGSGANMVRLWLIWWSWGMTAPMSNAAVSSVGMDPKTPSGILAASLLQVVPITTVSYPMERIKNYIQQHPQADRHCNVYVAAVRDLARLQGWRMFSYGFLPKVFALLPTVIALNYMVSLPKNKPQAPAAQPWRWREAPPTQRYQLQ